MQKTGGQPNYHNLSAKWKCDLIFCSQPCEGWDYWVIPGGGGEGRAGEEHELAIRVRYKREPDKSLFNVMDQEVFSICTPNSATTFSLSLNQLSPQTSAYQICFKNYIFFFSFVQLLGLYYFFIATNGVLKILLLEWCFVGHLRSFKFFVCNQLFLQSKP